MSEIHLTVNGQPVVVAENNVVAAALIKAGITALRHSVKGQPRSFVCGMGVCYECRVTINGEPNRLSCQIACEEGMQISTEDSTS